MIVHLAKGPLGIRHVKDQSYRNKKRAYVLGNIVGSTSVRGSVVVEELCYKPEVRGSRPDDVNELFQFT
jgi:hypothetical protein